MASNLSLLLERDSYGLSTSDAALDTFETNLVKVRTTRLTVRNTPTKRVGPFFIARDRFL
jgi:hypothetical protein